MSALLMVIEINLEYMFPL